jgi:hypothetical protein
MEINVHWDGFSDPHSGIAFYRAALGTEPFSENIEPFMNVGLLECKILYRTCRSCPNGNKNDTV